MKHAKTRWLRVGVLCVVLLSAACASQEEAWERYNGEGLEALHQGRYSEAERLLLAGVEEAEKFGEQDPRFATSLNNLAALYRAQGRYPQAEPLHQRALAIREKVLGPEHH